MDDDVVSAGTDQLLPLESLKRFSEGGLSHGGHPGPSGFDGSRPNGNGMSLPKIRTGRHIADIVVGFLAGIVSASAGNSSARTSSFDQAVCRTESAAVSGSETRKVETATAV